MVSKTTKITYLDHIITFLACRKYALCPIFYLSLYPCSCKVFSERWIRVNKSLVQRPCINPLTSDGVFGTKTLQPNMR